jgi:hypothetical protein
MVLIIHNVPIHSAKPKATFSQTTDKKIADKSSAEDIKRVSESLRYLKLYK